MKTLRTLLIAALCVVVFVSFTADDPLKSILDRLATYNVKYPEEKVYLHVDKPFYMPGENIWYSLYALNGTTHKPSAISNVAYVQLVDPKGNVVATSDLFVKDGTSAGDFKLQESAAGGIYKLKAFTTWGLNFSDQRVFEKDIQVQRIITPRMLLKLEWQREAYGRGDIATAKLTVRNLKDEKVRNASVTYTIFIGGQIKSQGEITTDDQGIANITFTLARDTRSNDGLLAAVVQSSGVQESISRSIPIVLNNLTLGFFPEGGDLVDGVENRVAFKALNEFGKAADITGEIVSEGTVVTTFESFHMGMGAFSFVPDRGKTYSARITKPAGILGEFQLPQTRQGSYAMNLKENNDKLRFNIISTAISPRQAFIVATNHGAAFYSNQLSIAPGNNDVTIDTRSNKTISGICVVTLFDENGKPVCERLAYVGKDRTLSIKLATDKKSYAPGEEVKVNITATDAHGLPVTARLSLSVVDDQLVTFANDKQDNILSWFMLSTEVKGKIEKPSFYFDQDETKADKALDFLLMTQGWRRFKWDQLDRPLALINVPEKEGTISGHTQLNKSGLRMLGEVTLIEMGNERRTMKIRTRADGSFDFINVDPTVPSLLMARKPYTIWHSGASKNNNQGKLSNNETSIDRRDEFAGEVLAIDKTVQNEVREVAEEIDMDVSMSSDTQSLTEVIVTGYGTTERRDLTGSSMSVKVEAPVWSGMVGIDQVLTGRMPGIQVTQQQANPGTHGAIVLRGTSSFASGSSEPLWVIDGVPVAQSLNSNFSNAGLLSPDQVSSIEVLRSPEAVTLYGSRAANGVIVITTTSSRNYSSYRYEPPKEKYNHVIVQPRAFTPARQFYIPPVVRGDKGDNTRRDFRSTVYWNQHVVTDKNGKATVSFHNNDNTSVFRLTAEGVTANGLIGREETTYTTMMPFSVDMKLPEFISFADTLKLPIKLTNNTSKTMAATVTIDAPDELVILPSRTIAVDAYPSMTTTAYVTILSRSVTGKYPLTITTSTEKFTDRYSHQLAVHPIGFPVRQTWSSIDKEKTIEVDVRNAEKGSLRGSFQAYPNLVENLFANADKLLREPHGCFEQVSSATFPNILALQYMLKAGKTDKSIESRANNFIASGYRQLMAYEIKGGGFEWFGTPAAHEALSAFGLIEFYEMQKVYDDVDRNVVRRTADWLMSRRDGKGGFKQNSGKYGFSAAPKHVNNAYIVYALAETKQSDFELEFGTALEEARSSGDMYRMALVAIAAHDLGKIEVYQSLVNEFKTFANRSELANIPVAHSITYSSGRSLVNETIGFWAQALAKDDMKNLADLNKCIKFLMSGKDAYGFGSTQATTVCLQALCAFTDIVSSKTESAGITLSVNGTVRDHITYTENERNPINMSAFVNALASNGNQPVHVVFSGEAGLPWQIDLEWYSESPENCKACSLDIQTTMAKEVRLNETVRLTATVRNITTAGLPMTMIVLGIPAGLSVQPWQLKELQEKGVFDFYEINGDQLALYYREVAPSGTMTINLDLKAELPGTFKGSASSTYLYYNRDCKRWAEGVSVTVR
jgi:TonB-dependent SusC/RagA subfamily outer membrane receptor